MKVILIKDKLIKAINTVIKMVSNQVTLPILSNILLTTENGRLKISATDLEIGIETWIGAQIVEEGTVTIPAKLFFEYISSISEEKITIEEDNNKINITGTSIKSVIRGLPANDFPLIPKIKKPLAEINIDAKDIKNNLSKCLFACATDETRPVLTGMLLKITKESYIFAATDSYRLNEIVIKHAEKNINPMDVIIPKRTLVELMRIIADSEEKIKIIIGENQIVFEFNDTYFISRLVEGTFPEYGQIIPKKFNLTMEMVKSELVKQLRTASLFSRDNANNIKLSCSKDKKIIIQSTSQQLGNNRSELNLKSFDGKEIDFSVNALYLLDVLGAIKDENIIIKLVDAQSPILIQSSNDLNYTAIIMPLRQEG